MYHYFMGREKDFVYLDTFVWDTKKNEINKQKHGISFELAVQIFNDPLLYTEYDKENSEKHNEYREMQIGRLGNFITLSVSTTDREDKIRIISARKSTKEEIKIYEQNAKNL